MGFASPARTVSDDDVRAYVRFTNDVRPLLDQVPGAPLRVPDMYLFSLSVGLLLHGPPGYIPEKFVAFFGFDSNASWSESTPMAEPGDVQFSPA